MAGVTGREVKAAFAKGATWGTPVSVTKQVLISSTEGLDASVGLIDDDSFNQDFLGEAEVGDENPVNAEIPAQARFEHLDTWIAMACGSAAAPSVVSSQAANSLVCASHVITMASELTHFMTLAIDKGQYVVEVPSLKVRGFNMRVGENGRMMFGFPIVGAKVNYDSATNIAATITGATAAPIGNRLLRKNGRIRMNVQSAAALGSGDEISILKDMSFTYARPLAGEDQVFNQDYIIEPEDDGFVEAMVEVTYARMNTISANSLAVGLKAGRVWKGDYRFLGPYVNSTTQRSFLLEMPAMQLYSFRAPVTGHNQVRPIAQFRLKYSSSNSVLGMTTLRNPFRITLVNANSVNLLA